MAASRRARAIPWSCCASGSTGTASCRAAVALFGSEQRVEFEMPQCRLRVARFRGLDRMEFLDNRQFGNACGRGSASCASIAGGSSRVGRIDEPLYPISPRGRRWLPCVGLRGRRRVGLAIYDDRLEVASRARCRVDAGEALRAAPVATGIRSSPHLLPAGPHEEWGRGTLKMAEETAAAGLPRPEIEDDGGSSTVCFRHGKAVVRSPAVARTRRGARAAASDGWRRHEDDALRELLALNGGR